MNEKEMLAAVKKAANVPGDGWGVTWNPLENDAHCAGLIAAKQIDVRWGRDCVIAEGARTSKSEEFSKIAASPHALPQLTPQQAMRRAVCRAVIGGAA